MTEHPLVVRTHYRHHDVRRDHHADGLCAVTRAPESFRDEDRARRHSSLDGPHCCRRTGCSAHQAACFRRAARDTFKSRIRVVSVESGKTDVERRQEIAPS